MRIYAFEVREDERLDFNKLVDTFHIDISYTSEILSLENIDLINGYDGITILGQGEIDKDILDGLNTRGIKYISTRTIGYNHIDVVYAKKIGIKICNANYEPSAVADFTLMLILMSLRKYKMALWRGQVNDYSLEGLQGREIKDLTIGIMGTGRIGYTLLKYLSSFGCRLLAYDVYENEQTKEIATYVDLDTLYRECDLISLHMPLLESTRYIIDYESISKMKDGVVLINCARGELMNTDALIDNIENKKIGALAIDCLEKEQGIYHFDRRNDIFSNREMAYLRQFPNVIMTQHMAFYTDAAVSSMVRCGVEGLYKMFTSGTFETEIH
jgi:lactate dehydrogenase-like 2-hydroxyacid dehydrogenase